MIIGFCGAMGSGKDTAGAYLVEQHGFHRIAFAAKLKESAAACFGIEAEAWEALKNDPEVRIIVGTFDHFDLVMEPRDIQADISARQFLQNYGTEAHRDVFGTDFWVEQALKDIDPQYDYVITDVRFVNEAEAVQDLGGYVIKIDRELEVDTTHASETGLPEHLIDGHVKNIGRVEKLYLLLDVLVEGLNGGDGA